jgi:hypothetical protein
MIPADANELLRLPSFLQSTAALPVRPRRSLVGTQGAARLASWDEVREATCRALQDEHATFLAGASPIVEVSQGRGAVEVHYSAGLALPEATRLGHLVTVGAREADPFGRLHLPLLASDLADPTRGVLVVDVGHRAEPLVTALMERWRPGQQPFVFDPLDPAHSLAWNPLLGPGVLHTLDLARALCGAAPSERSEPLRAACHTASTQLVAALTRTLLGDPAGPASFSRVRDVLAAGPAAIAAWAATHDHVGRLRRFVDLLGSGSNAALALASEALAHLEVFEDPRIARATGGAAGPDLGALLLDRGAVVVVQVDEAHRARLRPLVSMFLTDLAIRLVEHDGARPSDAASRPCSLHLDGLGTTSGWIPNLPARLDALRKCAGVIASVDGLGQIATTYGSEADAVVASFRSTIYAAGCDAVDAHHASRCSGTTTVEEERHTRSERIHDMQVLIESTTSTHFVPRPLLVPTEISHPPEHFALGRPFTLFLGGGQRPFQAFFPAARDAGLVVSTGPLSTRRAG